MKTKLKILKVQKEPKTNKTMGQLEIYNPFTTKRQQTNDKVINKMLVKKQSKMDMTFKKNYSSSDSSTGSDSDDIFKPCIKPIPQRQSVNVKKEQPKFNSFNIEYIPASKNDTFQRPAMKDGIIPKFPFICLINGAVGSGKTNMLCNMLLNPLMYGKDKSGQSYFDDAFCFTNSHDEILEKLMDDGVIPKKNVKHNPDEKDLKKVIKLQKENVKKANGDFSKVPRLLFIFDDIIDSDLVKSAPFKTLCIRNRHMNSAVFMLGQYFNAWPKQTRMQATNIMVFNGNLAEREMISETFCPSNMTKKEFNDVISFAWQPEENNKYPFLHICRKEPNDKRFRKSLINLIDLKSFMKKG